MWKYFLEERRSSWMTTLYCHGTPETDQTAWCRPASALKIPSLSFFCHSYTTTECVLDSAARQCAENVQTETRQRPMCSSATVLRSQREDKRVAIFPQCRFYCAGRFRSLRVMCSAVPSCRIKCCCLSSPPVREQNRQKNKELILEKQSRQIYEILLPFYFCAGNTAELITRVQLRCWLKFDVVLIVDIIASCRIQMYLWGGGGGGGIVHQRKEKEHVNKRSLL